MSSSSGRLALILVLGIATYLVSQKSDREPACRHAHTPSLPPTTPPVCVAPPQARVTLHPVVPLAEDSAPASVPPPTPEAHPALAAQLERVERRLAQLVSEVDRLRERNVAPREAPRKPARVAARAPGPRNGHLETANGASPVRAPRPFETEPGDILGLAKVTESLMQRLEQLEK